MPMQENNYHICMDKLQLTGWNLGRVFNYRNGRVHAVHLLCCGVKLPNFKLKTRPKQLLGSLPLDIALPNKCLIFSVTNFRKNFASWATLGYFLFNQFSSKQAVSTHVLL